MPLRSLMVFNKLIQKQSLLGALLLFGCSVYADEVSKMLIIDGQDNQIKVESFNFERLDSEDATTIKIETNKTTKVSCSIFDKNNRPVTTVEVEIKPPLTEGKALSKNVMVTSVRCLEIEQEINKQEDKLIEMYYKMPTFLLDKI